MEEYALASTEAAYENPEEQAPMGFMASGRKVQGPEKKSPWMDWKGSSPRIPTGIPQPRT